jgi:hypothetical protein
MHVKPAYGDSTITRVANDRDGALDLLTVVMKDMSTRDGAAVEPEKPRPPRCA